MLESLAWQCMTLIPRFGRQRQVDLFEFQTSHGYTVRLCLKQQNKTKSTKTVRKLGGLRDCLLSLI